MEFTLKTTFDVSPEEIYATWLSAAGHTKMTGGEALISNQVGAKFSAWDFYISGVNLELEVNKRIVQSWRTTEFEEAEEDSRIEILLRELDGQTELTLIHTNLPAHGSQYKEGWEEHYFKPMKQYFAIP
jgi:activator of HSP90 ATPase